MVEFEIPGRDRPKNLEAVKGLYERLSESHLRRPTAVAACGGASLCHLAGFVAATYEHGVPWVAFPTSLSGMFDPETYTRVGVEFNGAWSAVGATWPPALMVADPVFLAGLPARHLGEGLARAVSAAVVAGADMFTLLEENAPAIVRGGEPLDDVIFRYLELHTGARRPEPPGACLARVFAAIKRYGFTRGEATAVGLAYEGLLAELSGKVSTDFTVRFTDVLRRFGLPVYLPSLRPEELAAAFKDIYPAPDGKVLMNVPYGLGDVRQEYVPVKALLRLVPQVHRLARSR